MTSPRPNLGASAPSTQPLTPPADAPTTSNNPTSQATTTAAATTAPSPAVANPAQIPATSLQDTGKSRRPRDARLIHMLLASLGVTAYQERVPLQLLDFAYRYTSSTLQDAVYLATEGYPGESAGGGANKGGADGKTPADLNSVGLGALRMSIASRLHYQFQPGLPKEFLMDVAAERNRMMLPGVMRGVDSGSAANAASSSIMMGGVRLPPERFCLTGVGWGLKEEWESEGEEEMEVDNVDGNAQQGGTAGQGGFSGKEEGGGVEDEDEDDGDGTMEDIFGDGELDGNGQDEDKTMTDV
ncbi:Transcription initiation factor TFIID subunit 9 [Onygenales sp. PD_12]|nr:Transcription initiation factor TFIID subunit 9 [Onygenales sp. PD_12]KAK2805899.1 Transcription initiation factor TFIID subunit 9 [Onygenales sp. PD_10]